MVNALERSIWLLSALVAKRIARRGGESRVSEKQPAPTAHTPAEAELAAAALLAGVRRGPLQSAPPALLARRASLPPGLPSLGGQPPGFPACLHVAPRLHRRLGPAPQPHTLRFPETLGRPLGPALILFIILFCVTTPCYLDSLFVVG